MIHVLCIVCALLISVFAPGQVHAQSFFNTLPDIPLMAGLTEIEDQAFSFDKPEGRIMVGAAIVPEGVDDSQLLDYYQRALPQFGWLALSPSSYVRGNESLEISIDDYSHKDIAEKIFEITISP